MDIIGSRDFFHSQYFKTMNRYKIKRISDRDYEPRTIVNKNGLYFLIWQTTTLVDHKFVEYLGPFKDKQEVKNHFPHASLLDYGNSQLSKDNKKLIDLITQYWEFQRNPTIITTEGKRVYPVSENESTTITINTKDYESEVKKNIDMYE